MDLGLAIMLMETHMKVNGRMIHFREKEPTFGKMVQNMLASGKIEKGMDLELNILQVVKLKNEGIGKTTIFLHEHFY